MTDLLKLLHESKGVNTVSPWRDRYYVSLVGFDRSLAGDRTLKVWAKDDVLTIQSGKGYMSTAMRSALATLESDLIAGGYVRKGYSDSISATYCRP